MSREPIVDICMLIHNQGAWADLAIRAVEHNTRNPYRLILVDMASTEEKALDVLRRAEDEGHTVLHLAENRSFSHGCNAGAALGSSRFIVFLNDDALVTEGWDSALLQDASVKANGLVGARSNFAAGAQGDPGFIGEPPFLVFVTVALRREVWDAVGALDEVTFDGFSCEDLDYSWRVKKAGYTLKVSNAYVLHAGSRTLASTVGDVEAQQRNNEKYNARLADKWGKEWIAEHTRMAGKILVTSYSAEEWSRGSFFGALLSLKQSPGVGFSFHRMERAPIHLARQLIADYATDQGFDWLVQLDDDATFPPDLLRRLLAHGKDVVCALAYQRKPPYNTCCFEIGEDGMMGAHMEGLEHTGLRRVDVSGFHCSLMSTKVIKKLRAAGVKQYYGGFENKLGEDFCFSLNLKKHGIPLYCDTDLISGHIGASIIVDEQYKKDFQLGRVR